jgi:hypothetical protein
MSRPFKLGFNARLFSVKPSGPESEELKPGKKCPSVKPSPSQARGPVDGNVRETAIAECFINHVTDLFAKHAKIGKKLKLTKSLAGQQVEILDKYIQAGNKLQAFYLQFLETAVISTSSIKYADELSAEIAEIAKKVEAAFVKRVYSGQPDRLMVL